MSTRSLRIMDILLLFIFQMFFALCHLYFNYFIENADKIYNQAIHRGHVHRVSKRETLYNFITTQGNANEHCI